MDLHARKHILKVCQQQKHNQPADRLSLISAFVIGLLKNIISKLATSKISIFYLFLVAEQISFGMSGSETPNSQN